MSAHCRVSGGVVWLGEDYLPFAEIPQLRNMVLTGEDDGDMSYMRLQERQLRPAASNRPALMSSNGQYDQTAVVSYHSGSNRYTSDDHAGPSQGQGRYSEQGHTGPRLGHQTRRTETDRRGKRGGFRPTYD